MAAMRKVGIKQLKNRLSEYVRAAAAGETVLVTDRDRVVAELRPPMPAQSAEGEEALIEDWIARGIAAGPERAPGLRWRRHRLIADDRLTADLARDREDRR